ncbi:hypothetical protein TGAMA5MH_09825 [Trichoderma gamsii]|uniref:Mid2 domain-containing protein n=1 Tax=Trichoderma gamsii TaxID=398673 RepID=A0A2K0SY94_9HYPO|nr:hypothetical protein TGAMA5MH_09825 [Trichoderma gamsii]
MRSLIALLATAALVSAGPFPRDDQSDLGYAFLFQRDGCDGTPCGSDSQYCCDSTELCTTLSGNVATCLGGYGAYTSTWTETRTFTTTYFTHWAPVPTPTAGVNCVPQDSQQAACGAICCAGWQTCAFQGQCSAKPGYAEPTPVVIVTDGHTTTQYSAPYRVTGTTTITSVQTGTNTGASATATGDGEAIGAGSKTTNGNGLSPGAIAGIVIGTLVGVALLLLLCFCCIARGLWAAIFGKRRSNDSSVREEEVIEERYSKGGSRAASASAYSRRDRHGGWFGGSSRPATSTVVTDRREKRKSSSGGCWKWLGIGAVAATLFTLLNLKKDKRPNSRKSPSRYSNSYYSYSDYTQSNTASSSTGQQRSRSRRSRSSRGGRSQSQRYAKRP